MCLECKSSFIRRRVSRQSQFADFLAFYGFICNKNHKSSLSLKTRVSRTTLFRKFKPFFAFKVKSKDVNQILKLDFSSPWIFGIDGKWLKRKGVVIIGRNITLKTNIFWDWHSSESYENLAADFEEIAPTVKCFLPRGAISDWKGSFVSAVSDYLPNIPHQRCLSHLLREAKRLLPLKSPYLGTRRLRSIAEEIFLINEPLDLYDWENKINLWRSEYGDLLCQKTIGIGTKKKWWYTHGTLRRAVKLLTTKSESNFAFLKYPFLPKTNNSLEGLNSQIKQKLGNHRGMKLNQQISFIFWFLTFSRVENKKDLKKLWDGLKKKIFAV